CSQRAPDARLGSLADIAEALANVRFAPKSGHRVLTSTRPIVSIRSDSLHGVCELRVRGTRAEAVIDRKGMLMTRRHEAKVVVITGAASGIGRAFAARLASEGAHVVVADRGNADETLAEIKSFGGKASSIACDISLEGDVEQLARRVEAEAG